MNAAFILVHYHSARLLKRAVEAILADCTQSRVEADIVVVDNGSDDTEKAVLRSLPIRCFEDSSNKGFAAGLNLGIKQSRAAYLFLMNPDVFVLPGCVASLIDALEDGAAAAGPKFYWDEGLQFLLPPTERRAAVDEIAAAMAGCGDAFAGWARRRWRKHARRHWLAEHPIRSACLSGALIATRRTVIDRIGPFDEGYRLYFEEQDWLARVESAGLHSVYVPGAMAVHLFNQSAVQEPRALAWEAESAARFAATHYPGWLSRTLSFLKSRGRNGLSKPPPTQIVPPQLDLKAIECASASASWLELSPLARGFPAGATRLGAELGSHLWRLPTPVWERMAPGEYFITACADDGRELHRASLHRPARGL